VISSQPSYRRRGSSSEVVLGGGFLGGGFLGGGGGGGGGGRGGGGSGGGRNGGLSHDGGGGGGRPLTEGRRRLEVAAPDLLDPAL